MNTIAEMIRAANPGRSHVNIPRRLVKLLEELGEIAEAYLNVISESNGKGKTWDDVREEVTDVLIMCVDIALTEIPDCHNFVPPDSPVDVMPFEVESFDVMPFEMESFEDRLMTVQVNAGDAYFRARQGRLWTGLSFNLMMDYAMSLAYTRWPDQEHLSFEEIDAAVKAEVRRKLDKWLAKRARMAVDTDAL